MNFKVTEILDSLPYSLAVAKSHLRYTTTAEDDNIEAYIKAAVDYAENYMWRKITRARMVATYDGFTDIITLPRPPLVTLEEISYRGEDGSFVALAPSNYEIDTISEPARIWPITNWPNVKDRASVKVTYIAGYTSDDIPAGIVEALQLLVAYFFTSRSSAIVAQGSYTIKEAPLSADLLLDQYSLRVP
jgi:uncharacterized phiE125 gp8 family phage protein